MLVLNDKIWCCKCNSFKDPNTELYLIWKSEDVDEVVCLNCSNIVGQTNDLEWVSYWER